MFLYVVTSGAWRARTVVRDAVLFLAPVILAAPFIASAVLRQGEVGAFRLVAGWGEARFGDGPAAVAFFYLTNLGIPFVLAVVAAVHGARLCRIDGSSSPGWWRSSSCPTSSSSARSNST